MQGIEEHTGHSVSEAKHFCWKDALVYAAFLAVAALMSYY
jgi:hypothetical protein